LADKILIPKHSSFFTSAKFRNHAASINDNYPAGLFENDQDWFFFFHIDPAIRLIHAFGMNMGFYFYVMALLEWSLFSFVYIGFGIFFFYFLGVITHKIYDKSSAPIKREHLRTTFWTVIKINYMTTFGGYDEALREFVDKYPFTTEAHNLVEIEKNNLLKYLIS